MKYKQSPNERFLWIESNGVQYKDNSFWFCKKNIIKRNLPFSAGDLNIDLSSTRGHKFMLVTSETLALELNNDPTISKTKNNMTVDVVFSRYIDNLTTKQYVSHFSYHRPLICVTIVNSTVNWRCKQKVHTSTCIIILCWKWFQR